MRHASSHQIRSEHPDRNVRGRKVRPTSPQDVQDLDLPRRRGRDGVTPAEKDYDEWKTASDSDRVEVVLFLLRRQMHWTLPCFHW